MQTKGHGREYKMILQEIEGKATTDHQVAQADFLSNLLSIRKLNLFGLSILAQSP